MSKNHETLLRTGLATLAITAMIACSSAPPPPPADPAPARTESQPIDPRAGMDTSQPGSAPPLASAHRGTALPPGHPPTDANAGASTTVPSTIDPPPAGTGTGETGMSWSTPQGWIEEPPASAMRKAQYKVPGPGGDGELVVFYFGPGQGGTPMANAERWAGMFTLADGRPALPAMKTATTQVGSIDVLIVEVAGTYNGGMSMTDAPATAKAGYVLLGAIAEGADAHWFFKFTGPEATVRAQRDAFDGLVRSLKRGV